MRTSYSNAKLLKREPKLLLIQLCRIRCLAAFSPTLKYLQKRHGKKLCLMWALVMVSLLFSLKADI